MSEFEKDLRKKKEGTDTLNQNQENSTKPAVPAEGENNAPAAPAKKRIAAVYRPQNSTQKRPAGNRQQGGQRPARPNNGSGMQVRPTTNSAPAEPAKAAETSAAPAPVEVVPATDDSELIAVISAAIAAAEGTSTDGFVVRSIKRRKSNRWN